MNKNTIIALVLAIILLGAGIVLSRSNKNDFQEIELPTNNDLAGQENQNSLELMPGVYAVDQSQSKLTWKGKKILVSSSHVGIVPVTVGQVTIENNLFTSGEVSFDVSALQVDSQDSAKEKLEKHLKSKDFIDIENYPEAKFSLKSSTLVQENKFDLVGDLELNGVTNQITIPVYVVPTDKGIKIAGSVNIDRTLWNINFGSGKIFENLGDNVIDDSVEIQFDLLISNSDVAGNSILANDPNSGTINDTPEMVQ